ncbi:MAG: hypothetical protein HY782_23650 [Chloroflexi bacterium]|nr:hypothetical protein [Chloroflexota bacterium]
MRQVARAVKQYLDHPPHQADVLDSAWEMEEGKNVMWRRDVIEPLKREGY